MGEPIGQAGDAARPLTAEVQEALVANYRRFLSFLERRVGSRDSAQEILQEALARASEKGVDTATPGEAVTWFYRVLRNALVDHYRRRATEARALAALEAEAEKQFPETELRDAICACFRRLLPTLRPEYASILDRVDLQERPVREVADELSISANNASVRLFRARAALRKQLERSCGTCATHGCLQCACSPG